MTEWKYPGDEVIRKAFAAAVSQLVEQKGWTPQEFQKRLAEAAKNLDEGFHERAFGRAMKKVREQRGMTRQALAASAGIPKRLLIQVERGLGGQLSLTQVCRIAAALKIRPYELTEHYQDAVKQAD